MCFAASGGAACSPKHKQQDSLQARGLVHLWARGDIARASDIQLALSMARSGKSHRKQDEGRTFPAGSFTSRSSSLRRFPNHSPRLKTAGVELKSC